MSLIRVALVFHHKVKRILVLTTVRGGVGVIRFDDLGKRKQQVRLVITNTWSAPMS